MIISSALIVIGRYVELSLIPSRDNLKHIRLNAKQLRIYRVSLNESVEAPFQYFDPTLEVTQRDGDNDKKDLETFSENHVSGCNLTDPDLNGGVGHGDDIDHGLANDDLEVFLAAGGYFAGLNGEFSMDGAIGGNQVVAGIDG